MEKLAGYFAGDNYIQHNPQIADKVSGLGAALQAMAKQGITMKYVMESIPPKETWKNLNGKF